MNNGFLNEIHELHSQEPLEQWHDGDVASDFFGELKDAAWNVLHENPGFGFDEWVQVLLEQYPAEVIDGIGGHPAETYASLADMWDSEDYEDMLTGECHSFKDWAEYFATDKSVELFDMLAESRKINNGLRDQIARLQNQTQDLLIDDDPKYGIK